MPDGPVVLNNTPLVALWAIGRLDLLRDLFGEVLNRLRLFGRLAAYLSSPIHLS